MKKWAWLLIMFLVLAPLTGCGGSSSGDDKSDDGGDSGDGESYNMVTLPSKFSVKVPKSIVGEESSRSVSSFKRAIRAQKDARVESDEDYSDDGYGDDYGDDYSDGDTAGDSYDYEEGVTSMGCMQMKSMTSEMQMYIDEMGFMAVMADAVIAQNSLSADETEHQATLTLTQEMVNAVSELMGTDEAESMEEYIGQSMDVTVTYSDNDVAPYKFSVEVGFDDGSTNTTIHWSEDKSNTKLSFPISIEMGTSGDVAAGRSDAYTGIVEVVYDATQNLQTMKYEMEVPGIDPVTYATIKDTMKMDMSIKTKDDGAIFFANMQTGGYSYRIEGFADDNGGYAKTTMIYGKQTDVYNETFDADGKLVTEDSTYSGMYTESDEEFSDLYGEVEGSTIDAAGFVDGDYVVLSQPVAEGATPFDDNTIVVGYGFVMDGELTIQDVGGDKYSMAETPGTGKLYLYWMEYGEEDITFGAVKTLDYTVAR